MAICYKCKQEINETVIGATRVGTTPKDQLLPQPHNHPEHDGHERGGD